MSTIIEIKEKIRTENPIFTDELLDLLYEYFNMCYKNNINDYINSLRKDETFREKVDDIILLRK